MTRLLIEGYYNKEEKINKKYIIKFLLLYIYIYILLIYYILNFYI